MSSENPSQLQLFEERIHGHIRTFQQKEKCQWCKNPNLPIARKGLCISCYKWDKMQRNLSKEVAELPPKTVKDPYFQLRHELDVANCAVNLCQIDGGALEAQLERTDAIDLEHEFHWLSKRVLGSRRGERLFHGKAFYFYDFSPMQRTWLAHLISMIMNEMNRRDRLKIARSRNLKMKNSD